MRKRLGTKLYDTDTSELMADTVFGQLYRKKTREREWFLVSENVLEPMTEAEAKAMLGESYRPVKEPDTHWIMIRVDRETHKKIATEAKKRGVSIAQLMKTIVEKL